MKMFARTKFQLKLAIFVFWNEFAQRGCFQSKTEKVNTTIEFCLFKFVLVPNFSLNWQFLFFGPNLPKKGVSSPKQKKWTPPWNSTYPNFSLYQISAWNDKFHFLDQIFPKRVLLVSNRKSKHRHWNLQIWISLGTKFQFKLTSLIFWTKFTQRGLFQSKTEKMNITTGFCIFKLVYNPGQNIWNKIENENGHWAMSPPKFDISLIILYLLRS